VQYKWGVKFRDFINIIKIKLHRRAIEDIALFYAMDSIVTMYVATYGSAATQKIVYRELSHYREYHGVLNGDKMWKEIKEL
jgi:hypothetical protein